MKFANGSEDVMTPGPFSQLKAVRKCICPDGVGRYAEITGQPDTFFSIPARVKAFGKTVSGYATMNEDGYEFRPYTYRKNWIVFAKWIQKDGKKIM